MRHVSALFAFGAMVTVLVLVPYAQTASIAPSATL